MPELHNLNTDPLFVDSMRENYHLSNISPCIDSGDQDNSSYDDIDGIKRPEGPNIDRGSYEFVSINLCSPRADFKTDYITGTDSLEVSFDASISGGIGCPYLDDPNSIVSWDFGDGTTGSGISVYHKYKSPGYYDVSLTIRNIFGESDTLKRLNCIRINSSIPTKEVGKSGCAYYSIQKAIDDAADGEMILVHDGIYLENIDLKGKGITLISENGPELTIIDGNSNGSSVVRISSNEEDIVLDGFTIRNGLTSSNGGGIRILSASPLINNCIIRENKAVYGGGIYIFSGSPRVKNCLLTLNHSIEAGGGFTFNFPPLCSQTALLKETKREKTVVGLLAINHFPLIFQAVI